MRAAALEDSEWLTDAELMLVRLSKAQEEFTADDLRKVMRPAPVSNWTGIAFTNLKRAGLIEPVSYATSTTRTRKHGCLRTWRRKSEGVS
jgi:hypothetical protein